MPAILLSLYRITKRKKAPNKHMLIRGFFDQTDCLGLIFFILSWLQPSLPDVNEYDLYIYTYLFILSWLQPSLPDVNEYDLYIYILTCLSCLGYSQVCLM
jgi:hypothetical protein